MNECIINGKNICPHTELSGKLCSACKEPDRERLSVEWYHFLCLTLACFNDLALDERGRLTTLAVEHHLDAMKNTPEIMGLTSKDQKIMILEIMEDIC